MTEPARHALYEAFKASIAVDNADTVMAALPPVGWADVATKRDLDHTSVLQQAWIDRALQGIRVDMAELRADVATRLGELQRNLFLALFTAQATTVAVLVALA